MCPTHHTVAVQRSSTEKLLSRAGGVLGAIAGVILAGLLLSYWSTSGTGTSMLNVLLAFVIAIGVFLIVWIAIRTWIAPLLAGTEGKAARRAVRIEKYWPTRNVLRLRFENSEFADMFAEMYLLRLAEVSAEE